MYFLTLCLHPQFAFTLVYKKHNHCLILELRNNYPVVWFCMRKVSLSRICLHWTSLNRTSLNVCILLSTIDNKLKSCINLTVCPVQ